MHQPPSHIPSALLLFFVLVICVNISCTPDTPASEDLTNLSHQIVTSGDTLLIHIPDTVAFIESMDTWNFSEHYFSFLDASTSTGMVKNYVLNYYDFGSEKWDKIQLAKEGPNGVRFLGNYCFLNKNKILYSSGYSSEVFIINLDGIIERKIPYASDKTTVRSFGFNAYWGNNTLLFPTVIQNAVENFDEFAKSKLVSYIDLEKNGIQEIVSVPEDFFNHHLAKPSDLSGYFVFHEGSIVFTFRKSHNIYVYDIESEQTIEYPHETKRIRFPTLTEQQSKTQQAYVEVLSGLHYAFLYDKFNGLYYRISGYFDGVPEDVSHMNVGTLRKINRQAIREGKARTMITVFDQNFNVIARNAFQNLSRTHFFVKENGLFVKEKVEDESNLRFVHLMLKEKD